MRILYFPFAILWLLQFVSAADDFVDLVPLPRHQWDRTIRLSTQDEVAEAANTTLTEHEQLQWTSPPEDPKPKNVSLVFWTGQDRLILDMAKFGWELKNVNCTENMMFQFRHNISFQAAKKNWDWVNFNTMRSFVVIADHLKCGKQWSSDPWLVSSVRFDPSNLTAHMDAEKKTWKNVTHSYMMDWGEVGQAAGQSLEKRQFLDFNLDKAFTLDLASTWPSKIMHKNWTRGKTKASFDVSCANCGTSGLLIFAGHIEGGIFGGIDKFMISATPFGIQAALNLEIGFEGIYKFGPEGKEEFELLTIPLPSGWRIPGVLTFGPNAKILAGYQLEEIAGSAVVSTGVTAAIPDDSIAKVDLFAKKKLDVHGWIPKFETQPLQLQAELTATGSLYTKLAVAVSLEVLDENGVNVDVNLQFPKVKVTASGGYNAAGFCNADPFGVSLDVDLGAELELEGWTELGGKRNVLFEVDLYENDQLVQLPVLCVGLGSSNEGTCSTLASLEEGDEEWYNIEIASPAESLAQLNRTIQPSPTMADRDGYFMTCQGPKPKPPAPDDRKYKIELVDYPKPTDIAPLYTGAVDQAPVMDPGIDPCGNNDSDQCTTDHWIVTDTEGKYNPVTNTKYWAAEHVYEGFWLKAFLDHLYGRYSSEQQAEACDTLGQLVVTGGWTGKLASQLGSKSNFHQTMTVFTQIENGMKHRQFHPTIRIDSKHENESNRKVKLCIIGRIINTCQYMMHSKTQSKLRNTLIGIQGVYSEMDASADFWQGKPMPSNFTTWAGEHKAWFTKLYGDGIIKAQRQLQVYSGQLLKLDDFDEFDPETKKQVAAMADGNVEGWCKNTFEWP